MGIFSLLAVLAIAVVALLHVAFFVLESFFWTKPLGRRVFRLSPEHAEITKSLAFNQGFYNAFLAAGLVWGLAMPGQCSFGIKMFFLACVIVAGIVGGLTAKRSILIVQALPAIVAMLLVFFSQR